MSTAGAREKGTKGYQGKDCRGLPFKYPSVAFLKLAMEFAGANLE